MPSSSDRPLLSKRFDAALAFASELHRGQSRKHSDVPYISHLLAVCALVLEHGGDENQAIAALLHDGPEDQGGQATLDRIRGEFGDDVATLVEECTERSALGGTKGAGNWKERKQAYLVQLVSMSSRAALIAGCDKLHNAQCLIGALLEHGDTVFKRFGGLARGTRWWYGQLAVTLGPRLPKSLERALIHAANEIEMLPRQAVHANGEVIRLQTCATRFWSYDQIGCAEKSLPDWTGYAAIHIDGGGPMFLYTYLAARAARQGIRRLSVTQPGREDLVLLVECRAAGKTGNAELSVERIDGRSVLIRSDGRSKFENLGAVALQAAESIRPGDEVVVTGAMPMGLAAAIAYFTVVRGAATLACITPPDGLGVVSVHGPCLGQVSPAPAWLEARLPLKAERRSFGVIGFPNSGKSVYSKFAERAMRGSSKSCWVFEADPASPTPPWFVDLARTRSELAAELRNAYKVEWTDQMQEQVASRLKNARMFHDRLIVDMPGGDMENPNGPQPIPKAREPLFQEIERFIIIRRPDLNHDVKIWIDALAAIGLGDRVHAVLDSIDNAAEPSLELDSERLPNGWLTGRLRGLRRDADLERVDPSSHGARAVLRLLEAEG